MGFRYQLVTPDGEVFGEGEWMQQPDVGDVLYVDGGHRVRVLAYIRAEKLAEFVDRPIYGVLEVEPI
jgi:hypothetical protein